jgi:Meckel syndrome type 1 protein
MSVEAESLVGDDLEILADSVVPPAPEASPSPAALVAAQPSPAAPVAAPGPTGPAPRRAFAATLLGVPQAPTQAMAATAAPAVVPPAVAPAAVVPPAGVATETPSPTASNLDEASPTLALDDDDDAPTEVRELAPLGAAPFESPLSPASAPAELPASTHPAVGTTGAGSLDSGAAPWAGELEAARPKGPNKAIGFLLAAIVGGGALAAIYANQKPKPPRTPGAQSGAASAAASATTAPAPAGDAEPSPTAEAAASATTGATEPADAAAAPSDAPAPTSVSTAGVDPFVVEDQKLPGCDVLAKGVTARTADAPGEASAAWAEARKAIMKGDLETANLKMCEAVTLHDQSAAIEGLALLYVTRKSPSQGLAWLTRAEAVRPGQLETQTLLGVAQSQLGHEDEALTTWLTSLHIAPSEMERRQMVAKEDTTVGRRYLKQGDVPRAERLLRRAAILDPQNALALTGMGEVCLKEGRAVAALAFADRAIGLFEANPDAHVLRGDAALLAGDKATARASYERALAVRPDFWAATLKLRALDAPN